MPRSGTTSRNAEVPELRLEGLVLRSTALGESDRLMTLLSGQEGVTRLAVPGARRPRSSLAAAVPMVHLQLQVGGSRGLRRVRQLKVIRSFASVGQRLETLAGAQALAELCLKLVAGDDSASGMLATMVLHLERLEGVARPEAQRPEALAITVQAAVQLLAIGGFALPLQTCARSGRLLDPPLGQWEWRCSLIPAEGLVIGAVPGARLQLNPSELALLQRLLRPTLPRRRDGSLLGPTGVWLHLLDGVDLWCREHLGRAPQAFRLLRSGFDPMPVPGSPIR